MAERRNDVGAENVAIGATSIPNKVGTVNDSLGQPKTNLGNFGRGYFGMGLFGGKMADTKIKLRDNSASIP